MTSSILLYLITGLLVSSCAKHTSKEEPPKEQQPQADLSPHSVHSANPTQKVFTPDSVEMITIPNVPALIKSTSKFLNSAGIDQDLRSRFSHLKDQEITQVKIALASTNHSGAAALLGWCVCGGVNLQYLRYLTVLFQVNQLASQFQDRHSKLVHTAFAEEGLRQTYVFVVAAHAVGFDHIELNIIGPNNAATPDRIEFLKNLPGVKEIDRFNSGSDYIQAVHDGKADRSHSFDFLDGEEGYDYHGYSPSEFRRFFQSEPQKYSDITVIGGKAPATRPHVAGVDETAFFHISLFKTPELQVKCAVGKDEGKLQLAKAHLLAQRRKNKLNPAVPVPTAQEAKLWAENYSAKFCKDVTSAVQKANSKVDAQESILSLVKQLHDSNTRSSELYDYNSKTTDPIPDQVARFDVLVAHGAEADFAEMIGETMVHDFNPVIFEAKCKENVEIGSCAIHRHKGRYLPSGLSWLFLESI